MCALDGVSRRTFLGASALAAGASPLPSVMAQAQPITRRPAALSGLKALVFDVFGTVVDWRASVAAEVEAVAKRRGVSFDPVAFADAWRGQYGPSMDRVRRGELPWTTLDRLHRMSLDVLLPQFKLTGLTEAETVALNKAWHRLRPWPDSVVGLTRLKTQFIVAPLSNGNIALMTDLAKFAGLPWDCILGAELARHYKPDPEVYRSAAEFLDLRRDEVMMVAAHFGDLKAAKAEGLRTAFVARPDEYGHEPTSRKPDLVPTDTYDITARDFNDLATQLGV